MKFRKKISKKELIKTLQNNYEVILKRKNELYNENIKLQKENQELKKQLDEANTDKIEMGIEIDELKHEKKIIKSK